MLKLFAIIIYLLTVLYIWVMAYFETNYIGTDQVDTVPFTTVIVKQVKIWSYVPIINTIMLVILIVDDYLDKTMTNMINYDEESSS